jgi:plastocyanin
MPDWSIKIQAKGRGKTAVFTPDIDGAKPGSALKVVQGDLVSWNNMTNQGHWPVPDDRSSYGLFTTTPVDPDESSTAYNVVATAGTTISYHCYCHPEERGTIVVVPFGTG